MGQPPDPEWLLNVEKQFVAFFRPRCGSTTLTRWFYENLGYKFGGVSIAAFRAGWTNARWDYLAPVLERDYDRLHKFVVIRNPFDRAVSGYLHSVNNQKDYQWNEIQPKLDRPIAKDRLTFRQFVAFLFKEDLDQSHTIWRRQSALACWKRGVDDVIPLGALNEYLLRLNQRFGFLVPPSFNSVTVSSFGSLTDETDGMFADVPFSALLRFKEKMTFKNFPHYRFFYDQQLRMDLSALYREDLEIYAKHAPDDEIPKPVS